MPKKTLQVIKAKGGQLHTLRGGPVDLAKMGKISVERVSEILFNEDEQKYYINWFIGQLAPCNEFWSQRFHDTYESAVEDEVFTLNMLRKTELI